MAIEEKLPAITQGDPDEEYRKVSRQVASEVNGPKKLAKEMLKYVKRETIQLWLPIAPMPTDLCRVSPFFPDNRKDIRERRKEYIDQMVITKSSWGDLKFNGPRLTTYEEDVLLAALALLNQLTFDKELKRKGAPVYSYTGPALPVLKLMGINHPGGKEYKRLLNSLRLLSGSVLELTILGKEKKGKRPKKWLLTPILSMGYWDEEIKMVKIAVNPYFYETYQQKNVTFVDVWERSRIRSPIAKCLYRFMKSHRANRWEGHLMTLSTALNLDIERPSWIIRKDVKRGISELKRIDFLEKGSGLTGKERNMVVLLRNPAKVRVGKKAIDQDNPPDLSSFLKGLARMKGLPEKARIDHQAEAERQKKALKAMQDSPDPEAYCKRYLARKKGEIDQKTA